MSAVCWCLADDNKPFRVKVVVAVVAVVVENGFVTGGGSGIGSGRGSEFSVSSSDMLTSAISLPSKVSSPMFMFCKDAA